MPPAPPPSLPPEEPQHQFINPAELFVQPPLPTAPRSRYGSLSQYVDPSDLSTSLELPPMSSLGSSTPPPAEPQAPQAPDQKATPTSPQQKTEATPKQSDIKQSDIQIQPPPAPKPVVKVEPAKPKPAPKKEVKQPAATPKKELKKEPKQLPAITKPTLPKAATPIQPQPTPSPTKHAVPQVMIPPPSQEFRTSSPKPLPKRPQPKKQPSQQTTDKIAKPTKPPVDYQVLLLSLADEYLNAAHRLGTKTALVTSQADVEEYYKLVSTGLGCLEAVLKVSLVFC